MKKKYINNLDEALLDSIKELESNDIDRMLQEEGFNLDNANLIADKNVRRILFMSRAVYNKTKDERLLEVAAKIKDGIEKGLDKPISLIKTLISKNELSFQFRNLERLGEEELKDIIRGHNLLEILEELEKDNDGGKNK